MQICLCALLFLCVGCMECEDIRTELMLLKNLLGKMVVGMWEVSGDVIKMKSRRPAGTEPV